MKIIGITGGIGSGKSEASAYLEIKGATIIDADLLAREVTEKGEKAYCEIVDEFGEEILYDNGTIDRPKLSQIVFSDKNKLARLNEITHKYISSKVKVLLQNEREQGTKIVVIDVALPVKEGFLELAEQVWLVFAEKEVRINRLVEFRGYTHAEAQMRIENQPTDEQYKLVANVILDNNGELRELFKQIDKLLDKGAL